MASEYSLGPAAMMRFLDIKRENGELPEQLEDGVFVAAVLLDGEPPYGEVKDLEVIGLCGETYSLADLPEEFTSSLAGEVLISGKDHDETYVLFREDEGEVVAVFPFTEGSRNEMLCYAVVGQHSSCSLEWLKETKPASPEDYKRIKAELEGAPFEYKFEVLQGLEAIGIEEQAVLAPR